MPNALLAPRTTFLECWGDSLTASTSAQHAYVEQIISLYSPSRQSNNNGVGGETSTQIATRFLSAPWAWRETVIIWAGRNNYTAPTTVKADIASMVASLTTSKYLVLSIINGDYANEYAGQTDYNTILALNADLAALYGARFLDVRTLLVAAYDPSQAQDVIDHGHDVPPASLRVDNLHLTSAGYAIVAAAVKARLVAQGGW